MLRNNSLLIGILVIALFSACNIKEEGCLDIRATNFAFDADKPCADCCTYPRLYLRVSHTWNDTTPFRQNQVYITEQSDTFRIIRLDFLLSEFELTDGSGLVRRIGETQEIFCEEGGSTERTDIPDDIIVINLTNLTYEIGTFASDTLFQEGSCIIGLSADYDCAIPDSIDNNGPLAAGSIFYDEVLSRRVLGRMIIQKDTSSIEQDTLFLPNAGFEMEYPLNRDFRTGRPDTLFCTIAYQEWFEQIELRNQSNETISQQMTNNIPGGIIIR